MIQNVHSRDDHTYNPTNFATKVRSVGVWLDAYDNSNLSETPRMYRFPTFMDVMLVPDSTELDTPWFLLIIGFRYDNCESITNQLYLAESS